MFAREETKGIALATAAKRSINTRLVDYECWSARKKTRGVAMATAAERSMYTRLRMLEQKRSY